MESGIFTAEKCKECMWQDAPNCPRVINDNPELDQMCDGFTQLIDMSSGDED